MFSKVNHIKYIAYGKIRIQSNIESLNSIFQAGNTPSFDKICILINLYARYADFAAEYREQIIHIATNTIERIEPAIMDNLVIYGEEDPLTLQTYLQYLKLFKTFNPNNELKITYVEYKLALANVNVTAYLRSTFAFFTNGQLPKSKAWVDNCGTYLTKWHDYQGYYKLRSPDEQYEESLRISLIILYQDFIQSLNTRMQYSQIEFLFAFELIHTLKTIASEARASIKKLEEHSPEYNLQLAVAENIDNAFQRALPTDVTIEYMANANISRRLVQELSYQDTKPLINRQLADVIFRFQ